MEPNRRIELRGKRYEGFLPTRDIRLDGAPTRNRTGYTGLQPVASPFGLGRMVVPPRVERSPSVLHADVHTLYT